MDELFEDLRIVATSSARGTRVEIHGEIDLAAVDALRDGLAEVIADGAGDVGLDMSGTTFCDSVGLCALLDARRRLAERGRRLRIVSASSPVLRLLELTGTREVLAGTAGPVVARGRGRPRYIA